MTNSGDNEGFGKRRESPHHAIPASSVPASSADGGSRITRRSRHSRNRLVVFLNFLLTCVILAVLAAGVVFYIGKQEFEAAGPSQSSETIIIEPNTGLRAIASQLEAEGLISDSRIFTLGVGAYGNQDQLKAGEYEVEAKASMHDIMELLKSGKTVLHTVTIPEGLTVRQAFDRIARTEALSGEMPEELPPEGSLATDTINFQRGTERAEIVRRLKQQQEKLVESIWSTHDKDLPIETKQEFVTMASIVEKETGVPEERPRVAAVFLNRLKKGMRLQSDPTVIYGLYGGEGKPPDRPIYQSDLDKQTPYNTYQIDGLPPTPIANPGRAALEAVANPADTDDLYFVADGSGGHVFASTLSEHNRNVARWRDLRDKQQEAEKAEAAEKGATDGAAAQPDDGD